MDNIDKHIWIVDAKTLLEKCSKCGVLKRYFPVFKYGRFQAQGTITQYAQPSDTVNNKLRWSKSKIACKPKSKNNGKERKNKDKNI